MRPRARKDFEISPWTDKILLWSICSVIPRHMSEIPSSLQIKCSCFVFGFPVIEDSLRHVMMTFDAAVNKNLRLTSSETISELLCGAFIFPTEMCLTDSFFRTCNNQHAPASAKK